MCLILFAYRQHPQQQLVLAANRDEFYQRPTRAAHFWSDAPGLFAGRDLQAGGTWMGISRSGRFAAVTNVRDPRHPPPTDAISRGALCSDFLQSSQPPGDFLDALQPNAHQYAGFNLLLGQFGPEQPPALWYYSNRGESNRGEDPQSLAAGVYGLSNGRLDEAWPKVTSGKAQVSSLCTDTALAEQQEALFALLRDEQPAADANLPDTGVGLALERDLSSRFINMEHYGTRTSTVLTIANDGEVAWQEQHFVEGKASGNRQRHRFQLA